MSGTNVGSIYVERRVVSVDSVNSDGSVVSVNCDGSVVSVDSVHSIGSVVSVDSVTAAPLLEGQ